ncbi:MAG: 50S ribosomal protein L17 [Bacteroidales bacterium]
MRHGKKINHLGRTSAHRHSMLANMAASLILSKNKRINTTLAKAKALRTYIEPLITRSKEDSTNSRRVVFSYLQNKEAVTELFREVATKIAQRPGGYTRILKTGFRQGDNADMCLIELVDYNENLLVEKQDKKAKTTRRSRGGAKKDSAKKEETELEEKAPKKKTAREKTPAVESLPTLPTGKAGGQASKVEKLPENEVNTETTEEKKEDSVETKNEE